METAKVQQEQAPATDAAPLAPVPEAPPRTSLPRALLAAMRPRQWTKNAAVFAPLVFAQKLFHPDLVVRVAVAVAAFCLLSSAVYLVNDIADREKDRLHPTKRLRPIASGALSVSFAALFAFGLACIALGGFFALGLPALYGALGYLGLQVLYTGALKKMVLVDVFAIAIGFVVRVATGALAIDVPISNWLYLCTFLLALFLGFSKRRHELMLLEGAASAHRANLSELSLQLVDQIIGAVTAATVVSYALYTMSEETIHKFGSDGLKFTIPFVMYGLFRYLFLIYKKGEGGSPEKLLLTDAPLLVDILLFGVVACVVIYAR